MNYHNQPEQVINKRVAEILGIELVTDKHGNNYDVSNAGCELFFPTHSGYTRMIIEKLLNYGELSISSNRVELKARAPLMLGGNVVIHSAVVDITNTFTKALCIILCEVCEGE